MLEHIAIQGVERWIVDVGGEHALAQIIQHHHARAATQPTEGLLVRSAQICELDRNTSKRTDLRL
jgi:hypothetical protein